MADQPKQLEIVICLGSSCFARGNKQNIKIIQSFIKEKGLENSVSFRGQHCFGHCECGPSLKIGDKVIERITPESILEVLNDNLLNQS